MESQGLDPTDPAQRGLTTVKPVGSLLRFECRSGGGSMHTCGEEISHMSTSPLTEHSVHDSAIPKRNHGLWDLASSELAMPQASPGGLAELARIKARVPCPLQQKPQGSEVSGPGHEGFQLHGGRSPLRPPTLLLSSRPGWPQLPSLMSPEPRVGLAVGIYTGAEATSRSSALWGQPLGSDWTVAQDSGGLPGGAFHWLEAEDPVCQEPCLAVGSVAVQPPSAG